MQRRTLLAAACGLLSTPRLARAAAGAEEEVDVLLVLAADVSQSMGVPELTLQRQGYAAGLRAAAVQAAVAAGPCGAVALCYIEWSGAEDQRTLLPWTRVDGPAAAEAAALRIAEAPLRSGNWTSITGALAAGRQAIAAAPFVAARLVMDISGDGENNQGGPPQRERDAALEAGIVINGLPILRGAAARAGSGESSPLEAHYRAAVIGGPGAFMVPSQGFEDFARAIRRKLVMEIAGDRVAGAGPA
jgi:hypothetical protein